MPAPSKVSFEPFSGRAKVVVPRRKATREDWRTMDMPERHIETEFRMELSPEQLDTLGWGHVPSEMEDRWFTYMEEGRLHLHRSWTGSCIFIVTFGRDGCHRAIINRDPEQYSSDDVENDIETLRELIRRFSAPTNCPYLDWLDDTADAMTGQNHG